MNQILVIDDEQAIRESLVFALERDGFQTLQAKDLAEAKEKSHEADFLLLDLMLPDGSGIEFLTWFRTQSKKPVIILTSRAEESDRIVGLELGADDYVTKPFSPREVVARVRAVCRRLDPEKESQETKSVESIIEIDLERRKAHFQGSLLELSKLEFDLLHTFAGRPGRVFERDELLDKVWGSDCVVSDRTVDVHIKTLRAKIVAVGGDKGVIETVRGVGYRLREI